MESALLLSVRSVSFGHWFQCRCPKQMVAKQTVVSPTNFHNIHNNLPQTLNALYLYCWQPFPFQSVVQVNIQVSVVLHHFYFSTSMEIEFSSSQLLLTSTYMSFLFFTFSRWLLPHHNANQSTSFFCTQPSDHHSLQLHVWFSQVRVGPSHLIRTRTLSQYTWTGGGLSYWPRHSAASTFLSLSSLYM